ncbi:DNA-binding protein [Pseudoxanthomonas sp. JBR18]|uniref:DNA-binding protein n=1 Tax=Pseudoxanthomonas sp. JBR18 TaxID=2969308 RepID=UPI0023053AC9|nr:DNA-binding protein [Pseudoxanthomonas sp. JBR18]WCE03847.1 DNA-binding protein [Pseudoxanthomonas sp. JBR18]
MARGITEADVHGAADALVAAGERPTVERIRAHLGTGSPNTVVRWLETWWQGLGDRIASNREARIATANVPEAVAALAGQWWTLALDQARTLAEDAVATDRATLLDAQHDLEHDRRGMREALTQKEGDLQAALQAERLATARGAELERLVAHLQHQLDELGQQRNAAAARASEAEGARDSLQVQLRQVQDAARAERDTLIQYVRATEDRAHTEVDRARQESREMQQQLAALQKEAARAERHHHELLERTQASAASMRQELTVQQTRADALEAQLGNLRDLPAALEAAWRQRADQDRAEDPKPVRPRSTRGTAGSARKKGSLKQGTST